ncbi:MAG: SBBP repeat-containing protein [Cryomorphaceae bacterium]
MIKRVFSISLLAVILPSFAFSQTDIELVYQSLLGGNGNDGVLSITELSPDSIIVFGNTESTNMEMINPVQGWNQGGSDAYLAVLNETGEPVLTTYWGGSENDQVSAVSASDQNDILIAGSTFSQDFPIFSDNSVEFDGFNMGFISKFNEDLDVVFSILVGGDGQDAVNAISVDEEGNIYIAGITTSIDQGTPGTFQPVLNNPENTSGFIAKYSPTGEKLWYTYIEGSGITFVGGLEILPNAESVIAYGYTTGEIPADNPIHQPNFEGGQDCILTSFDINSGTMNWFTYYGGNNEEFGSNISIDSDENIYIVGETDSGENISTTGSYQEVINGFSDFFLAKFSSEGERLWGTYFGAAITEFIPKLSEISNGEFYLTGRTQSETGLAYGNPILASVDLPSIFSNSSVLAKFSDDGDLIWSTYAPESHPCGIMMETILVGSKLYSSGAFPLNSDPDCYGLTEDAYQIIHGGGFRDFGIFIYEENFLSTSFPQAEPLTVYPNPAQDQVTIEAPNLLWAGMDLTVTDLSGRQVDRVARFQSGNTYSMGHLSEGVYILTGQIGERMFRQKLVVQR